MNGVDAGRPAAAVEVALEGRGVSVEPRPKVGVESGLGCAGVERNEVSGAVRSTVQVWVAGVASRLPAASSARTSKV